MSLSICSTVRCGPGVECGALTFAVGTFLGPTKPANRPLLSRRIILFFSAGGRFPLPYGILVLTLLG